jgi:hypothetical protein
VPNTERAGTEPAPKLMGPGVQRNSDSITDCVTLHRSFLWASKPMSVERGKVSN